MIKAFLFDLDGTLQYTEVLYVKAWQSAYREKGCSVSDDQACEIVYGRAKDEVYKLFHGCFPEAYPNLESIQEVLANHFNTLRSMQDIRILESIELLNRLSEKYSVAIVSGNSRQDIFEAVEMLNIGEKLAFFLGCEDYAPGKPHPACFLLAADKLNIPPSRCMVFEDSEKYRRSQRSRCLPFAGQDLLLESRHSLTGFFDSLGANMVLYDTNIAAAN